MCKLLDETNYRLFVCLRDFEPNILIKGVHLTRTVWWEERYNILWIQKRKKSIYHRTSFYSIFDVRSCIKPEIQNDLPKIIKFKVNVLTNSGQKSLTMFISSCFNNCYASGGIRTRNPCVLRLRNTCAVGCAKKTAENVFKIDLFIHTCTCIL